MAAAARLAATLAVAVLATGPARAVPPEFLFPAKVAGLTRGERTDYEARQAGLGYSQRYARPGVRTDLYVYDRGLAGIPDGAGEPVVQAEYQNAADDIRRAAEQGIYRSAGAGERFGAPADAPHRWQCGAFDVVDREGEPRGSTLCLNGLRGAFVKLRVSAAGGQPTRGLAERFLSEWAARQGSRAGAHGGRR